MAKIKHIAIATQDPDCTARFYTDVFGISPRDIQVLAPMHRGPAGVGLLNERLQARLNPPAPHKPELRGAGRTSFSAAVALQEGRRWARRARAAWRSSSGRSRCPI